MTNATISQDSKVNEFFEEVKVATEQLFDRWEDCSFQTLSDDIKELKILKEEPGANNFIYESWLRFARDIFDMRVAEIYEEERRNENSK